MGKKTHIEIKHLGKNALLQLQKLGFDVSKYLGNAAVSNILSPRENKYGVSKKEERTGNDGYVFASKLELNFDRMLQTFHIQYSRQPTFILQDAFILDGKQVRPIKYRADFLVPSPQGELVLDCKGYKPAIFKVKSKMFEQRYRKSILCFRSVGEGLKILQDNGVVFNNKTK